MKKILIWVLVGLVGLGVAQWLVWEVWKDYMGQLENNANCSFYSEEEYAWHLKRVVEMPVPEPVNPFPVKVTLDMNGLPTKNISRMMFNHGTPPIKPPKYESVEYIGPFQQTFDVILSDTDNEWPFLFHPALSFFYDKERAICFWDGGEAAEYIQDGRGHPHFLIELLPYRRIDIMSGYNIKRID